MQNRISLPTWQACKALASSLGGWDYFCPRSTASSGMTISVTPIFSGALVSVIIPFHIFKNIKKNFNFWLHWVFVAAQGLSLVTEWGLLSSCRARASHCGGFSRCGAQALGCAGFRSCDAQVRLPLGLWDLQGTGIKPGSPVLAGGFLITGPQGKAPFHIFNFRFSNLQKAGRASSLLSLQSPMFLFTFSEASESSTPRRFLTSYLSSKHQQLSIPTLLWHGTADLWGHISVIFLVLRSACCRPFPSSRLLSLGLIADPVSQFSWRFLCRRDHSLELHTTCRQAYSKFKFLASPKTHLSSNCLVSPFDPRPAPEFSQEISATYQII